jgi:hypothetical protein
MSYIVYNAMTCNYSIPCPMNLAVIDAVTWYFDVSRFVGGASASVNVIILRRD